MNAFLPLIQGMVVFPVVSTGDNSSEAKMQFGQVANLRPMKLFQAAGAWVFSGGVWAFGLLSPAVGALPAPFDWARGLPIVEAPTKIAPASMERALALMSPMTSARAQISTRLVTVMFPSTRPCTITVPHWISA